MEARQALSTYLSYLEATAPFEDPWKAGHHPWLDARGLAFEKMLVAGRLAIVQERQGDSNRGRLELGSRRGFRPRGPDGRDPKAGDSDDD